MPEPIRIFIGQRGKGGSVHERHARHRALARFAGARDGIVTPPELERLGFSHGASRYLARHGRIHLLFWGVYAGGHRGITQRGLWRAAVAACGQGALLSHRSAGALWGLPVTASDVPDVTVGHGGSGCRGIRVHHSRAIGEADRALRDGIRVTAIPRTLIDVAALAPHRVLRRVMIEAERMRVLDGPAVLAKCGRGKRGSARLRAIIESELGPAVAARSELELRFQDVCRRYDIPMPQINVVVEGVLVDAYWPEAKLVVELDGDNYHRTAGDRRRDTARDRILALTGHQVLRFGWDDVTGGAAAIAQAVLTMLARRTDPHFR